MVALDLGYNPVKVNCVVMRGLNDDELPAFVKWTKDVPIQIRFIEYMPFDGNTWSNKLFMPYTEMIEKIRGQGFPLDRVQGGPNDTSKTYKVDGYVGSVGFISSMSDHFCGTCNRLRLMADGSLKVCLFGQSEVSLRDMLRDGADDKRVSEVIAMAVQRKNPSHDGMFEIDKQKKLNRPMILIGG